MDQTEDEALRQQLVAETAKIAWKELQVFFAQGKVFHVSAELDLVETAVTISTDDSESVKQWLDKGLVAPVSDAQARQWFENDILVWTVVVKPWVLVQNTREAVLAV